MEAPPLHQQGHQGFAMPDPYGLAEFTDSLLPNHPAAEEVLEALHMWEVPEEAYPPCIDGLLATNYQLDRDMFRLKANTIHVYLMRQAFVTSPAPYWPRNESFQPSSAFGKSYFSFFGSTQFSIGPVENPVPPGRNSGHKGYNHPSAMQAWGEAKIMAGWANKSFAIDWCTNFKLYQQPEQPFPPVLSHFIWCCWPDLAKWLEDAELVLPIEYQEPDVAAPDEQVPDFEELVQPDVQAQLVQPAWHLVQPDWLHIVDLGVAAMGMQMEDPVEDPEAAVEVPHPDQEICSLYDADWDAPPPLIPVVDLERVEDEQDEWITIQSGSVTLWRSDDNVD